MMRLFKIDPERATVTEVEGEPWPGKDSEGDTVYENTHFPCEEDAWDRLKGEVEAGVKLGASRLAQCEMRLLEAKDWAAHDCTIMAKYIENRDKRYGAKGE